MEVLEPWLDRMDSVSAVGEVLSGATKRLSGAGMMVGRRKVGKVGILAASSNEMYKRPQCTAKRYTVKDPLSAWRASLTDGLCSRHRFISSTETTPCGQTSVLLEGNEDRSMSHSLPEGRCA